MFLTYNMMLWIYVILFVNTYTLDFAHDNIVFCNSEHPENSRLRPKYVGA